MTHECVYQATDHLGYGRMLPFLKAANAEFTRMGVAAQTAIFSERMQEAWKADPINRWLAANCFGDYDTHAGLDLRLREMIPFYFLLAQGGCEPQLIAHA